MAPRKKTVESSEELVEEEASEVQELIPVRAVQPRPVVKKVSFVQWASFRDVPIRHRPGLKAFVKFPQKKRSIEEWDNCFKNY